MLNLKSKIFTGIILLISLSPVTANAQDQAANPYLNKSVPKLAANFSEILAKATLECTASEGLALLASASTLVPVIGGLVTNGAGELSPELKNGTSLPWQDYGIATLAAETAGAAVRTAAIGGFEAARHIGGIKGEAPKKSDVYNYDGSWAILSSWVGVHRQLVFGKESLCHQQLSKAHQIVEAIVKKTDPHHIKNISGTRVAASEQQYSPTRLTPTINDGTYVVKPTLPTTTQSAQ